MSPAAPSASRRLARDAGARVFGTDVGGYHGGRLAYPAALYRAIAAKRGCIGGVVLEIGPGTGLATRDVLAHLRPDRMVAVEADPVLAAHLADALPDPRLRVVPSSFTEADLVGPFDLVCAAASFHWLEPEAAFARLLELLRPGATLALWWNVYRQQGIGDPFADAVTPLLADLDLPPSEGAAGHYSLDVAHHRAAMSAAGLEGVEHHLFRRDRTLGPADARTLYSSYSYVRALSPDRRRTLLDAIATLVRDRFDGAAPNVVLTPLYLATMPAGRIEADAHPVGVG